LRAGAGASTQECAATRGNRRRAIADSDFVGEAFGVDATEQLDGDVDVPICRAWHDRRRKIVTLNDSHSVSAPTESNTDVRLRRESYFVGVNSYEQKYIGRTVPLSTNSERGGISSRS